MPLPHQTSFAQIARQELSPDQLEHVAVAMELAVRNFPDDPQTRSVYMQGALRVVTGIKPPAEIVEFDPEPALKL